MIIDEKGKLFGKISIVDLLFLLILVAAVAGAVGMVGKVKNQTVLTENRAIVNIDPDAEALSVQMLLKEVRDITADALEVGDDVFESESGKFLGRIIAVDVQPAMKCATDVNGSVHWTDVPSRNDILITVEVPGKLTDKGYYSNNNQHLVYGSQFGIKTTKVQTIPILQEISVLRDGK